MMKLRRSEERGHADHGWLNSYHTFSFANYHDPEHMGYRSLRVINDDRVAAGRGFGAHAHRDMEILTYVLDGQLAHKDSMGHTELLGPNEIQKMSAGSGVVHSEFNGSTSDPVHFLQIWIEPQSRGTAPNYEQYAFQPEEKRNRFRLLASSETVAGAARLNQDAKVSVAEVTPGNTLTYALADRRHAWVHVVEGEVTLNGEALATGDAVAVEDERELRVTATGEKAEVLVFDLA
jgi:quercetin 2,3-dioxygenase